MENPPLYDVRPDQYASVIRDLMKHENDLTNHRTMWLLVIQGLLVNAFVAARADVRAGNALALSGILVTLSAFALLYKSYQARGYLNFLGAEAKLGHLPEEYLRLNGWPHLRIKHWRKGTWMCPWVQKASDLLEPYLFLPCFIISAWIALALRRLLPQHPLLIAMLSLMLAVSFLFGFCVLWLWSQRTEEQECTDETV